ncbi:glycine zipper 2TM domain-containing protein [Novosphingobium album (ex Hu et al. 2023)]|uniref:17 kDa surface antigen n=1 Tax=Novosphingobium album (ex Hu et al. 2023) TaxID=2930093 RepID=A0ABT0B4C6_9SPHN|nr:glycine zipper 2TM domain-containing protein [Novosphingobium album (ex Hu et al. 2023)]MCJ2179917.1 glycine zipper 2TM domain-containing protein [Novosphingobium album (ex Hu et al. 2023)]
MRLCLTAAAAALTLLASPVASQDAPPSPRPASGDALPAYPAGPHYGGFDPAARDAWLADCRRRVAARDSAAGGAVIGGVVGGIAGNRIAGRHHRTMGTFAGAAVGAAAGAAIDKTEDAGRNRDECEAYLDDYYARYTHGGGYPGYGYGQSYYSAYGYSAQGCCTAGPMMMVPIIRPKPHCTETVETVYEDVPERPARRTIPKRTKTVPDKRVKLQPVK